MGNENDEKVEIAQIFKGDVCVAETANGISIKDAHQIAKELGNYPQPITISKI